MSFADGKEFVIKNVFTNVLTMEEGKYYYGEKVTHFQIPWKMSIQKNEGYLSFFLKCLKSSNEWSIEADVNVKLNNRCEEELGVIVFFKSGFSEDEVDYIGFKNVKNHLVDNKLIVEMHVRIIKATGFKEKMRTFDDESAKKFSDVVLIVGDEKFYVCKKFLASHSPYFEALFMGNFDESKQSEIPLKDIDPCNFQEFLELLHGESDVDDYNVDGIVKLGDMYDSKTAIRKCEKFLTEHSKQSLKQKFHKANKYNMDELKKKCMTEIKTKEDILSVLPQDVFQLDLPVWAELLHKCISFK